LRYAALSGLVVFSPYPGALPLAVWMAPLWGSYLQLAVYRSFAAKWQVPETSPFYPFEGGRGSHLPPLAPSSLILTHYDAGGNRRGGEPAAGAGDPATAGGGWTCRHLIGLLCCETAANFRG